jgi:hypothetical protein
MKKLDLTNFQDLSYLSRDLTNALLQKAFFTVSIKNMETITMNLFRLEKKGFLEETPWVASIVERNIVSLECHTHCLVKWITKEFNDFLFKQPQEKKIAYYFEEYNEFVYFFDFFSRHFVENDKTYFGYFGLESIVTFVFGEEKFIELVANQCGLVVQQE